jgi:hypothetical protein
VVTSCEHGDEPSGSIKCGEFLDQLSVLVTSQEGLCYMELVIVAIFYLSRLSLYPPSSTRNMRSRHAVVTRDPLNMRSFINFGFECVRMFIPVVNL